MRPESQSKILLVLSRDDELVERVRDAARVILDQPEPMVVRNGAACLAALRNRAAALLILDDEVQRASGPVMLYRLRSQYPQLRIVYVAHQHSPELELEVRQIGVLYYTSKPIDCWEFACLVAGFMGLRVTAPRAGPCLPPASAGPLPGADTVATDSAGSSHASEAIAEGHDALHDPGRTGS